MAARLKFLDRYLTLWIFLAMAAGVLLGNLFPGIPAAINSLSTGSTNILLAIGLILMMYPPLTKVNYRLLPLAFSQRKLMTTSLLLNWIVGPMMMFLLALLFLRDQPAYFSGVLLIGIARCIAMVIVWNDLAGGNRELGALLVALNSIFQLLTYSLYAWFFLSVLPPLFDMNSTEITVPINDVASSVLIYLGIPFVAGFLSRMWLIKRKGLNWYNHRFIPTISPITLFALLFTIVLMFSLKGEMVMQLPEDVLSVVIPLSLYFILMFFTSFFLVRRLKVTFDQNIAVAFTATGNNFELAIAVAIAVFGLESPQAFAGVIGPLVEVPVLILLVKVSKFLKTKYYNS